MATLQHFWLHLLILLLCSHKSLLFINSSKFHHEETLSISYTYDRLPEVEDNCGRLLSSRSKLAPDDKRGSRLKQELSFANGDWSQDPGSAPLMPLQDHEDIGGMPNILNLASFHVVDVDYVERIRDAVSISGMLELAIDRMVFPVSWHYREWSPEFYMSPGQSILRIVFEGIYVETEGERSMCLLGTAKLPVTEQSLLDPPIDPMESFGQPRALGPSLVRDDQIMLVLKYPKDFDLTGRGIRGEMTSLKDVYDIRYFGRVDISSQLMGSGLDYRFGSREYLLKKGCKPYPYRDESLHRKEELALVKGDSFCNDLQQFAFNGIFNFVPGKDYKNHSNPFGFDIYTGNLRLLIQDLRCHLRFDKTEMTANVSAVFRLISSGGNEKTSRYRTGLNRTLAVSAEGTWRSSSGQLCMIGCSVGPVTSVLDNCDYRICIYMTRTFSLTGRSIIFGTITRINGSNSSLRFEMPSSRVTPEKYHWSGPNRSYEYSRIPEAVKLQKRRRPSAIEMLLRKSILKYPTWKGSDLPSFYSLSEELSLDDNTDPQDPSNPMESGVHLSMQVLSLGSFFSWYRENEQKVEKFMERNYLEEGGIPISGHLSISGGLYVPNMSFLSLSFEGLFDPSLSKMSLIACRDVLPFPSADANPSLERGKDCLIEAEIQYPPENLGWLVNPKVKVSISSKRTKPDPLHFNPVDLRATRHRSWNLSSVVFFRKKLEAGLCAFLLLMSVLCIFSQLNYTISRRFVSLSTLGLQAISYCLPFISGNEELFKGLVFIHLDSAVRILLLVAFLLTLRLCHKVWDSRQRYRTADSDRRTIVPDEKKALLLALAFHSVGFLIFSLFSNNLTPHIIMVQELQPLWNLDSSRNKLIPGPPSWLMKAHSYAGLVSDFFLLPQILSNICQKNIEGKPLRKLFYMGLTITTVVAHVYDYVKDPVTEFRHGQTLYYNTGSVHMRIWNIVVTVVAITLAVIMYFQQLGKKGKRPRD